MTPVIGSNALGLHNKFGLWKELPPNFDTGGGGVGSTALSPLSLSARSVAPEAALGALIGNILNGTSGSTIAMAVASSFVGVSASTLVKAAKSFRPAYHNVTLRETKDSDVLDTTLTLKAPRTSALVTDFEDLSTGWLYSAAPSSHDANMDWFLTGKQSLRLASNGFTGTLSGTYTLPASIAIDTDTVIDLAFNCEDITKISSVGVVLTNAANATTQITWDNVRRGPARYSLNIQNGSAGAFAGPITKVSPRVFQVAGGGAAASIDDFRIGKKAKAKILLMVDDGYSTQVSLNDMLVAKGKGWHLSALAVESGKVGTGGNPLRATLSQLQSLAAAGVPMINHTGTHSDLTAGTQAAAEADIQTCIDYIQTNGLSKTVLSNGRTCKGSEYHCAYPFGSNSAISDAAMRAKGMLTGWSVLPRAMAYKEGVIGYFTMYRSGLGTKTQAAINAEIDAAIANGSILCLFTHDVNNPASGIGITPAIAQGTVDYIDAKHTAGLIDFVDLTDLYEELPEVPLPLHGVNLAGGEFGSDLNLGVSPVGTYSYPTTAEKTYYGDRGVNIIRVPFKYHRLIDGARAPRSSDITPLRAFIVACNAIGITVVLDMHEYGIKDPTKGISTPGLVYADFWQNISADKTELQARWHAVADQFKDLDVRYGIMNEPTGKVNSPNASDWAAIASSCTAGIREVDTAHIIHFMGIGYGSAEGWVSTGNAAAYLANYTDSANKTIVELHQYLDNGSGQESNPVTVGKCFTAFVAATVWARTNNVKLFLGEIAATQDGVYIDEVRKALRYLHDNRDVWIGWTYWGGGPRWPFPDNSNFKPFSPEPADRTSILHVPQMNMLTEFLPVGA